MPCPLQAIAYIYLKSNMDRFIAEFESQRKAVKSDLKSNMDRFIGYRELYKPLVIKDLKSNMDRFIVMSKYAKVL